jgi:IMP dehydrogenase/GMP reductase
MSEKIKLDWNDISIIPESISDISSRLEINPLHGESLPLFASPMDTVVDENNYTNFLELGIGVCLPRHIKYESLKDDRVFYSYGLDEIINIFEESNYLPKKVLIDVANGNMKKLWDFSKILKEKYGNNIELMVGNIANPKTYRKYCEIGVDWIRVGVGAGQACTTSANVSIHYPMASLVNECFEISKEFEMPTKIVADGGFKNYSDIIKALALGSHSVMLGSLFNKCIESCSKNYILNDLEYREVTVDQAREYFKTGGDVYKYFRGMSTKEVQKYWNKKRLVTSEGITKYNRVEYALSGWTENFIDYLKSAMSYTNSLNLNEFIGGVDWVQISQNSFMRFNK